MQISQALSGSIYLVGGKLSLADVLLVESTLMLEEKFPAILSAYPNIKVKRFKSVRVPRGQRYNHVITATPCFPPGFPG